MAYSPTALQMCLSTSDSTPPLALPVPVARGVGLRPRVGSSLAGSGLRFGAIIMIMLTAGMVACQPWAVTAELSRDGDSSSTLLTAVRDLAVPVGPQAASASGPQVELAAGASATGSGSSCQPDQPFSCASNTPIAVSSGGSLAGRVVFVGNSTRGGYLNYANLASCVWSLTLPVSDPSG
jgi:hypothetical protein